MPQTVTPPPSPPSPPVTPPRADQQLIDQQIARTRRGLKTVDLSSGLLTLVIGVLLYLLAAALIDQWVVPGGLGTTGRFLMFAGLLGGTGWYCWRTFVPLLLRSVNPIYAAQTIEENSPSLKNSLLSLLMFRGKRQPMSAQVYQAIEHQTAERLSESPMAGLVDRSAVLKLGYALVGVAAICALYQLFSPKNPADSFGRVLAPWADIAAPSRVKINDIQPGAASVARGERLKISAEVLGNHEDEPVELHYSSVDQQIVDQRVLMIRNGDTRQFSVELPPVRRGIGTASGEPRGIEQDLQYWITAGDARSIEHPITVYSRPTIVVTSVRYEYPSYTGFPSQTVPDTGDIRAVEGTEVIISALANQPIKSADVDFAADGRRDLSMSIDGDRATARFMLRLREDRRTPEYPSYVLRLTTTEDRQNRDPAKYRIEVTPDYAPEVRVVTPTEPELEVRIDEKVRIDVEARDPDFAVGRVELKGQAGNRELALGRLLDENFAGRFTGSLSVTPEELELKAGDVLEYWAKAEDNRRPEANVGLSERRQLRIIGAEQRPKIPNADQEQQDKDQQGKGEQQEQGEGGEAGEDGAGTAGGGGGKGEPGEESQQGGEGEAGDQPPQEGEQAEGEGEGSGGGENSKAQPNEGNENQGQGGGGGDQANPNAQPDADNQQPGEQQGEEQGEQQGEQNANPEGGQAGGDQQKLSAEGEDDAQAFDRINEHLNDQEAGEGGAGQQNEGQENEAQAADPQANGQQNDQPGGGQNQGEQPQGAQPEGAHQENQAGEAGAGDQNAQPQPGERGDPQEGQQQPQAGEQGQPGETMQPEQDQASGAEEAGEPGAAQAGEGEAESGEGDSGSDSEMPQADQEAAEPKSARGEGGNQPDAAQPRPDQEREGQTQQGEDPKGPDSSPNRNQGESGGGENPGENQGSPSADPKKSHEKEDSGKEQVADSEPGSKTNEQSKQESDAESSQSGDRSGEGQEGPGQQSKDEGKGGAGESTSSEEGGSAAQEQGEGETGDSAGDQQASDDPTGKSGDQPGNGSEQSSGAGKQQGGDEAGQPEGEQSPPTEPMAPENQQPKPQPQGDQQGEDANEPSEGGKPPEGAQGGRGSAAQEPSQGGTTGGEQSGPMQGGDVQAGDKANLDYAKKQTDLVLDKLEDQLAEQKVDQEMLDKLGWKKNDLQKFVDRWRNLEQRAAGNDAEAQTELNESLRSLGLREGGPKRFRSSIDKDKLRDLNEAYRGRTPLKYRDRVRAYVKGAAGEN